MTEENLKVLLNIIGCVESGGQVYGQRNYSAYAGKGQNSSKELTCTLGWAQFYGYEAMELVKRVYQTDIAVFRQVDTAGIEEILSKDWVDIGWNPNEKQKAALIAIITTPVGKRVQDEYAMKRINKYLDRATAYGVTDIGAQMMWAEIQHLGGKDAVKRIFDKTKKPHTVDSVFAALMTDQQDQSSNNQVGDRKFQSRHEKCVEFIKKYALLERKEVVKMASTRIANCGHDENNRYRGGRAGDQTGGEWAIIPWYSRPWAVVLRHPNKQVSASIATLARLSAQNNLIGYDQNERTSFWSHLKASNYDPSQITVACEADCSAGTAAIVKAVGFKLGIPALQGISIHTYTGNLRSTFRKAGFQTLTESKYLSSSLYLEPGDVLLLDNHHVAINLDFGDMAKPSASLIKQATISSSKSWLDIGDTGDDVLDLQIKLQYLGYYHGKRDKEYGQETAKAVGTFQHDHGLVEDRQAGTKTLVKVNAEYSKLGPSKEIIKKLQAAIGAKVDGFPGPETLGKCPILKEGSKGKVAGIWQEILNSYRIGTKIDGDFGTGTGNSTQEFQYIFDLEEDRIVGRKTWAKALKLS